MNKFNLTITCNLAKLSLGYSVKISVSIKVTLGLQQIYKVIFNRFWCDYPFLLRRLDSPLEYENSIFAMNNFEY